MHSSSEQSSEWPGGLAAKVAFTDAFEEEGEVEDSLRHCSLFRL